MSMSSIVTQEAREAQLFMPPQKTEGQKICWRRVIPKIAGHVSLCTMATSVSTAMPIIKHLKLVYFSIV